MSTRKRKASGIIPIAWRTCHHCGKRYDEGNAYAAFEHRIGDCPGRAHPTDTEPQEGDEGS